MVEPLNIPFIVDTTIRGGTFQTPILQDITHGQRKRSRLFHTREDDSLPFHYAVRNVRSEKLMLECSNHRLSNCKAAFMVKSINPETILHEPRPGKKNATST